MSFLGLDPDVLEAASTSQRMWEQKVNSYYLGEHGLFSIDLSHIIMD